MSKKVRRPQAPKQNKKWDKQPEVVRERPIKNKIKKRQKYRPKEVDFDWD
jgi:hypothetical protein